MILVDTSAWIHFLRTGGDAQVTDRVRAALEGGDACWCDMVRLELWNGAGGAREKKVLREFDAALPLLPTTDAVWTRSRELATACRETGITVPATDLLIAACAFEHGVPIECSDADFERIRSVA